MGVVVCYKAVFPFSRNLDRIFHLELSGAAIRLGNSLEGCPGFRGVGTGWGRVSNHEVELPRPSSVHSQLSIV